MEQSRWVTRIPVVYLVVVGVMTLIAFGAPLFGIFVLPLTFPWAVLVVIIEDITDSAFLDNIFINLLVNIIPALINAGILYLILRAIDRRRRRRRLAADSKT